MDISVRNSLILIFAAATTLGAQTPVPIHQIGPILASSTENVGQAITVRATSDGHVIVGAGMRQRVYAFDSTLKNFTLVADSGAGTGIIPVRTTGVIAYLGDSTLLPDFGANALLVLDATGKQIRSMAPPRAQDLMFLALPAAFGRPGFDPKGRLIYRTQIPPNIRPTPTPSGSQKVDMVPVNPDSAPILRGDFDTRKVDTIVWLKTPTQGRMGMEMKDNPAGGPPSITMHMLVNPFPLSDEWALLSDGTIAIVRAHDYHIDWVDPDGTRRSSAKMPIDWRRYTDDEKRQRVDSIKKVVDEQLKRQMSQLPPGAPQIKIDVAVVPDSEFPQFWPPIQQGSVLADLNGRLWILPTTSTNAANGLTYDVVNRKGDIVERIQLPKDRALAGFGPHNVIYLTRNEAGKAYLERALLGGPPKP
jgi:hypothetical protein